MFFSVRIREKKREKNGVNSGRYFLPATPKAIPRRRIPLRQFCSVFTIQGSGVVSLVLGPDPLLPVLFGAQDLLQGSQSYWLRDRWGFGSFLVSTQFLWMQVHFPVLLGAQGGSRQGEEQGLAQVGTEAGPPPLDGQVGCTCW